MVSGLIVLNRRGECDNFTLAANCYVVSVCTTCGTWPNGCPPRHRVPVVAHQVTQAGSGAGKGKDADCDHRPHKAGKSRQEERSTRKQEDQTLEDCGTRSGFRCCSSSPWQRRSLPPTSLSRRRSSCRTVRRRMSTSPSRGRAGSAATNGDLCLLQVVRLSHLFSY